MKRYGGLGLASRFGETEKKGEEEEVALTAIVAEEESMGEVVKRERERERSESRERGNKQRERER